MEKPRGAFPTIETARLTLREIVSGDAALLHRYWSDEDVTEFMVLDRFTKIEDTVQMIVLLAGLFADGSGVRWAVVRKEDGAVLGTCGFHNLKPEHFRAEVGYEMGKEYWGRGLMTEALTAILGYGIEAMDFNRVEAFVNAGNIRSLRILEKLGFRLDGTLREYERARGVFVDQHCLSLLRKEWVVGQRARTGAGILADG
ncbi:GNAT family N-acetyltransferase [Anaeroselena agilis]|uniref:GNAT family protein n=1 Tax=Anaeroselena agilis TaxID=3063788 RepID=A0ABU3P5C6_9FIRM|nr:GNAT family protein [Selenomonadales bacterium 4137-cl]